MKIDFMSMTLSEIIDKASLMQDVDARYQHVAHQIELLPMDAILLSKKVKELKEIMRERRLVKECSFFLVNLGKDTNYKVVVERANQAAAKSDERLARYVKESMESCHDTAILS